MSFDHHGVRPTNAGCGRPTVAYRVEMLGKGRRRGDGEYAGGMATPIATPFTGEEEADRLLTGSAFALVVGKLLDQQVL